MSKIIFKGVEYASSDNTWIGTKAEYELQKNEIPDGYTVILTDDVATGTQVVVDEVRDGDMNPVTSNAVYDSLNTINTALSNKPTIKNISYTYTSATTLKEVVNEILTNNTFAIGHYIGTISSTHSGGGDMGTWAGHYTMTVNGNSRYQKHGIVSCQGHIFMVEWQESAWYVKEVAFTE
jgi:hypothetical protein